jgi:ferredoxin-NADP reductase
MTELVATAPRPSMWERVLGSRLAARLAYPRSADRYAELADPLWSSAEVRAEVVEVRRETRDTATLVLRPNRLWRGHLAGQHVALTVELSGVRRTRTFSLSSAPSRGDGLVEVTVKARPGGAVTPRLLREVPPGQVVTLSQAQGTFVLPEPLPEQILLISGGSGVTPVMAMLRELLLSGSRGEVVFLHHARSPEDVIFGEELRELARSGPGWLRVEVETGEVSPERPGLTEASLEALVPDYERWATWVCGPEPLMAAVQRAFEARGAAGNVHTERFSVRPGSGEGKVSFRRSGREAEGKGKALLVLAEEAGLKPRSGCRAGICHLCTCKKVSGVTRDMRTGALSAEGEVEIQLCVSEPLGAVMLDL